MTRTEIQERIWDMQQEIEAVEADQPNDWWPAWEKARDLEGLRAKLQEFIAKL